MEGALTVFILAGAFCLFAFAMFLFSHASKTFKESQGGPGE
jgi:hypothetical protein